MTGPVRVTRPIDALISYHYYRDDKQIAALINAGCLRMIGDSGAYSAFSQGTPIKLAEYASWVKRWQNELCWCAALDVIGDPAATLRNWRTMLDRHHLQTVPTLHVGADPGWMDPYVREGVDFFGLGGMVGRAVQSLPWVVRVLRYARDHHPHVRFHLWGVTNSTFLDRLPIYSADSSGTLAVCRFATLRLFDPGRGSSETVQLRGNGVYRSAALLRRVYGVDPATVAKSHPGNRNTLIGIAARSTQLYAQWLQQRHQASPPTWGVRWPQHLGAEQPAPVGTSIHLVSAAAGGLTDDLIRIVLPSPSESESESVPSK